MGSEKEAEKLLNKLRKLPENRVCVNCFTRTRLGFSAVCVKFNTFVCNNCKSSHQAFSHRVKSVTMSTWTLAEVKRLRTSDRGGNAWGRARWYAKMTPEDEKAYVPNETDTLPKYKELIYCVYERKAFFDPNAHLQSKPSAKPSHQTTVKHVPVAVKPSGGASRTQNRSPRASRAVTRKVEEPEFDLLSFETPPTAAGSPDLMSASGGFQASLPRTNAAVLNPPEVGTGPRNSGVFDPFAVLDPKRKTSSKATVQKQFINAMASATGDPFAALHMNSNQKRAPVQVGRPMPMSIPQPGLQQQPQLGQFGMQMQSSMQQPHMTMPQQAQPPKFPGYQQQNRVQPLPVSMPYATKPASNDDPFAGLQ